jgi:ACS family tartrate transporter-like MFS transporter
VSAIERATIRKVFLRIVPFTSLLYLICYVDRINVGFAALTMNKDIGLTPTLYGWGAGIFFWGYCLFEVPSNVVLEKVGARLWICRIMITWGLLSGAMAFVTGPTSFIIVRFLFGVAEAGFAPGIFLYFTYWFPARVPRPHHRLLPRDLAAIGGDRRSDLNGADGAQRPLRSRRVAVALHL